MTIHQTRMAPSAPMQTVARRSGPVTLAIRAMRANEAPTWEMRQVQIDEERRALRALRERIANQVEAGLALLDALDGDPDHEVEDEHGGDIQDEPHDGDELEGPDDNGIADEGGAMEQRLRDGLVSA